MFIKPNGPGGALVMQRDMVFDVYVIVMSGSLYIETFEPNLHNRTVEELAEESYKFTDFWKSQKG